MRRISSFGLSVFILLAVMTGCTVKEERGACPCRLFLDLMHVDIAAMSPLSIFVASEERIEHEAFLNAADIPDVYEAFVPRTELKVMGWSGGDGYASDKGLNIPLGYDCPPVYIHSSMLHAEGESVRDTVVLRKNHCVMRIRFIDPEGFSAMTVRGAVSGFDMHGNPKPGDFRYYCQVEDGAPASTQVCLPRQTGDPLYLDVADMAGKVKTFPLREYIAAAGYDWSEPDLKDLSLTLNYTLTTVSLIVSGWDEEFVFDVVI